MDSFTAITYEQNMIPTSENSDILPQGNVETQLRQTLRDVLFRNAYIGIAAGFAALVGLYLIDWGAPEPERDWWCLALLFCLLGRILAVAWEWQQRSSSWKQLSDIPYYLYYTLSVAEAIVWGSSMVVIFPQSPLNQAFLLIVLIAIAVGAMATFTGSMSLYAIYATTMVIFACGKLVSLPDAHYQILGWLCWALLMVLLVVARRMNTLFADMVKLSYKNQQLALLESASKQAIVDFSEKRAVNAHDIPATTNGPVSLTFVDANIQQITERAVMRIQPLANKKRIHMYQAVDEVRPVKVDTKRIEDVLASLIERAVKQTPTSGSITVQTTPTSHGLRVEVIDTGATIDSAQIASLYNALGPVQDILRAHDSQIEVSPNAITGSCLSFILPWSV